MKTMLSGVILSGQLVSELQRGARGHAGQSPLAKTDQPSVS